MRKQGSVVQGLCVSLLVLISITIACDPVSKDKTLPYIGERIVENGDTTYHRIPSFEFSNQNGIAINNESFSDGIYLADFFYTYCPTICPIVISQMQRLQAEFRNESKVRFVSFALDPKRDNVERLKEYSQQLQVDQKKWHFLTGDKETIWDLAEDFFVSVAEDSEDPGEIAHSGKIILVDSQGHVRAFAEGTDEDDVTELIEDVKFLLKEIKPN